MKDLREGLKKQIKSKRMLITLSMAIIAIVCCIIATMKIANLPENLIKTKSGDLAENSNSVTISAISDENESESEAITNAKIVGGYNHFVALSTTGKVYTWGLNNYGQLGTNDTKNKLEPVEALATIENADGTTSIEKITDAIDVAAGNNMTLVLRKDGTVWSTGYNSNGQCGTGNTKNITTFKKVKLNANGEYLENIVKITAGGDTSYALANDGSVFGWGYNGYGQYGTNSTTTSYYPVKNENVSNIKQISAGVNYLCMLDGEGTVWCQGYNGYGQFGTRNTTSKTTPVQMLNTDSTVLTGVTEIATGDNHTVVLKEDGTVWAVGYNGGGQLGQGNTTNRNYIQQVKYQDTTTNVITDGIHVFAAGYATYVQKQTGGMYVIGRNSNGQLFTGNATNRKYGLLVQDDKQIISMAMTKNYSQQTGAIVDNDGKIYTVGYNANGEMGSGNIVNTLNITCITKNKIEVTPKTVKLNNVGETSEKITAKLKMVNNLVKEEIKGETFECYSEDANIAIVNDSGHIVATGIGSTYVKLYNKTENVAEVIRVSVNREAEEIKPKISGGYNYFAALEKNGTVWTWGSNSYGQLGINNNNQNEPIAVQAREKVLLENGEEKEQEITNVIDIATGNYYTVALKRDGTVWATGYNGNGELGTGDSKNRTLFEQVKLNKDGEYLQNIIAISAGQNTTYALSEDGTVWSWGYNGYGQIGTGDTNARTYPEKMNNKNTIVKISAGSQYLAMIDASGYVWSVGYNGYGQFGTGDTTNSNLPIQMIDTDGNALKNVKDIATGSNHTIILKQDGSVFGVGLNSHGELGIGNTTSPQNRIVQVLDSQNAPVTNIKNIYAAGYSTYLTLDKGMYVTGYNNYGQLYTGDTTTKSTAILVQEDKKIITVAALKNDSYASAFATEEGNVYTIGYNGHCELGNGSTVNAKKESMITKYQIKAETTSINFNQIGQNSEKLKATVTLPLNLINKEVVANNYTYSSMDENVAKVSSNGIVTSQGEGSTFIKIHNQENNVTASVYVNVNKQNSDIKVVSGESHFAALKQDGKIYTWGYNSYGQLATGDTNDRVEPTEAKETITLENGNKQTQEISNVKDIEAASYNTIALKNDGTVWSTGYNNYGQLGNGTTTDNYTFEPVKLNENREYLHNIVDITVGESTVYALAEDGSVWAWGYNNYGQLGIANTNNQLYPTKIKTVSNIVQIEAGKAYLTMLAADGTVWGTGYNNYGQLGINSTSTTYCPIQMLNADGTTFTGVKKIATGIESTVVLKEDGTVWSVGYNAFGQLGDGTTTRRTGLVQVKEDANNVITSIKDIYADAYSVYLLKEIDGEEKWYVMGSNSNGQLFDETVQNSSYAKLIEIDKKIKSIAVNTSSAAMATSDGMIYTVGNNSNGQLGNATTVSTTVKESINKIKMLNTSNMIIYNNIGDNSQKVSQEIVMKYNLINDKIDGKEIKYSSTDEGIATVSTDGTVTATGIGTTYIKAYNEEYNIYSGVKVIVNKEGTKAEPKIESGTHHFVSLKSDGTIWSWGYNGHGECATQNTSNVLEPTQAKQTTYLEDGTKKVEFINDVIDIATGDNFSIALKSDGTVWTTGYNGDGQLGNGNSTSINTYERVKINENGDYLENVVAIAAGMASSYAIAADGTVWGWGSNSNGELGVNHTNTVFYPQKMINVTGIIDIKSKERHLAMLSADGSVWSVGYNNCGQLGTGDTSNRTIPVQMKNEDGTILSEIKEIAVGDDYTLLLKNDNTVWGVGYNSYGQMGNGTNTTTIYYPVQMKTKVDDVEEVLTDVNKIYATKRASFIQKGNELYACGYNNYGQLCTGDTTNLYYATKIQEDKKIITISKTTNTTAFADDKGMVYTVGYNGYGEIGNNTIDNIITPVCISDIYIKTDEKTVNLKTKGDTKKIEYSISARYNLIQDELDKTACTFKSMDENIASITTDGTITAKAIGSTYIRIYNQTNDIYETVKVNINTEQGVVAPKVEAGANHFVALKSNGTVYTWGYNNYGQLGTKDNNNRYTPVIPIATVTLEDGTKKEEQITDAIDVAANASYTIILRKDGTVWSTGYNKDGQLGIGNTSDSTTFKQVKLTNNSSGYLQNVIAITAGEKNAYAITKEGYVYGWGYNNYGQLGINSTDTSQHTYATRMKNISNIMQISAGAQNVIMLEANGTVWGVGYNGYGKLGTNNTTAQTLPTKMLDAEGNILTNVKEIASGINHTLIQKEDGTIWGVGYNNYGQLGQGDTTNLSSLTQILEAEGTTIQNTKHIYSSGHYNIITTQDKGMYVIGYNNLGQLFTNDSENKVYATKVQTDKEVLLACATTSGTGIVVDTDGTIYTIGNNSFGEVGIGTTETASTEKRVTIKEIKTEKIIVDLDQIGQTEQIKFTMNVEYNLLRETLLGENTIFKSENENVATVSNTGLITAKSVGSTNIKIHNEDNNMYATIKVNVQKENIKIVEPKIVGGQLHVIALKANGTVWGWGNNTKGELGIGNDISQREPVTAKTLITTENGEEIQEIKDIVDIAAGYNHTLLLAKDGTVWASGYNNLGQLGNGNTESSNYFYKVKLNESGEYLSNIVKIAAGDYSSYAVTAEGEVYAWGKNTYGTLDQGTTDSEAHSYPVKMKNAKGIIDIDAECEYMMMLDYNGKVWGLRI